MRISLGRFAGLELSASPSALPGSLVIAAVVAFLLRRSGRTPAHTATVTLLAMPLHWLSDLAHHIGHAIAARQTGYPMRGVHFWGMLGTSLYPQEEPQLPAETHIHRALGGPVASSLLALVAALLWQALPMGRSARDLALIVALDNLILGPGALFPLPMTDGGTLRSWLPRRRRPAGEG